MENPAIKKPFLGRAVASGKIRFLSVSQIAVFDPAYESGCPRRWAYQKVFGKKEEDTFAQKAGVSYASQLEHWFKTGETGEPEDIFEPVLRAAKHLFPKPGPDIEAEKPLGDIIAAVAIREKILSIGATEELKSELQRAAGLTAAGIPLVGAADFRHSRGEYIDEDGVLRREPYAGTVEIGDLKTTSRINAHTTRSGNVSPGYAKTAEEVGAAIQMVGYGVHAHNIYSGVAFVRLSHIYAQTKNAHTAAKRTILLPVEEILRRWDRVETVAREMEKAAAADKPEDIPVNLSACRSFNRDCPHLEYCDRPSRTASEVIADLFQIKKGKNNMGFYDSLPDAPIPSNGAAPPPFPDAPPPFPAHFSHTDGYRSVKGCNGLGYYPNENGQGFTPVEVGHVCRSDCKSKPVAPHISAINPADSPPADLIAAAKALPLETIAGIVDPELKKRAEEHAAAFAARETEENAKAGKKEKIGGRCTVSGVVKLTREQAGKGKYQCPGCGKVHNIKKLVNLDFTEATIPLHNKPKTEESAVTTTASAPVVEVSSSRTSADSVPSNTPRVDAPPPFPTTPTSNKLEVVTVVVPVVEATPVGRNTALVNEAFGEEGSVSPPPSFVAPTSAGITLYVDVVFERGEQPKSLDEWAHDIVSTLEQRYGLQDVRLAKNDTDLGYGKWRAVLAAMAKTNVPPPGEYVLHGVGESELRQAIVEGLAPLCRRVARAK